VRAHDEILAESVRHHVAIARARHHASIFGDPSTTAGTARAE
jgi:hypothetical protein